MTDLRGTRPRGQAINAPASSARYGNGVSRVILLHNDCPTLGLLCPTTPPSAARSVRFPCRLASSTPFRASLRSLKIIPRHAALEFPDSPCEIIALMCSVGERVTASDEDTLLCTQEHSQSIQHRVVWHLATLIVFEMRWINQQLFPFNLVASFAECFAC